MGIAQPWRRAPGFTLLIAYPSVFLQVRILKGLDARKMLSVHYAGFKLTECDGQIRELKLLRQGSL